MSRFEQESSELSRRTVLKTASAVPIIGAGIAGGSQTAAATGESTFVIEQDGEKIPVTPLSYENQTIEQFYSYDSPNIVSANTPTGLEKSNTTRLFLYEGPRGISLVVIHDKEFDSGNGSVQFDFENLPSDGSWVVKDDPGEGYSRTTVDWGWNSRRTDGGAYRGDFQGQSTPVTISPSFQSGIDSWEVLSGDPRDPTVTELDLNQPITISSGQPQLQPLIDEKIQLAGNIDQVSASLSEQSTVESTLDELKAAVDGGSVSAADGTEAVERMILGEEVTEAFVGGVGPQDTSNSDTAGKMVDLGINVGVNAVLGATALGKIAKFAGWGRLGRKIGKAKNKLIGGLRSGIDTIVGGLGDLSSRFRTSSENIAEVIVESITGTGLALGSKIVTKIDKEIEGIRSVYANGILNVYEQVLPGNNIQEELNKLDTRLGPDNGGPDFGGSLDEVSSESETAIDEIETVLSEADDEISKWLEGQNLAGFASIFASALIVTGPGAAFAVGFEVVNATFQLALAILGLTAGTNAIGRAHRIHNDTLDTVING